MWIARPERARELACEERLTTAGRPREQDPTHVRDAQPPRRRRVRPRRQDPPHDGLQLGFEPSDARIERRGEGGLALRLGAGGGALGRRRRLRWARRGWRRGRGRFGIVEGREQRGRLALARRRQRRQPVRDERRLRLVAQDDFEEGGDGGGGPVNLLRPPELQVRAVAPLELLRHAEHLPGRPLLGDDERTEQRLDQGVDSFDVAHADGTLGVGRAGGRGEDAEHDVPLRTARHAQRRVCRLRDTGPTRGPSEPAGFDRVPSPTVALTSPPAASHSSGHAEPSAVKSATRLRASRTALNLSVSHHVPHSGRPEPEDSPPAPVDSSAAVRAASDSGPSTGCASSDSGSEVDGTAEARGKWVRKLHGRAVGSKRSAEMQGRRRAATRTEERIYYRRITTPRSEVLPLLSQ